MKAESENPTPAPATSLTDLESGGAPYGRGQRTSVFGISILRRLSIYLELTKPRLTLLSVLTVLAGFYLGTRGAIDAVRLAHLLSGTALLGAGLAALNQYIEWRVDGLMQRTAGRPLPSGRLHPRVALCFGASTCFGGIAQLLFAVNALTAVLAASTLVLYLFCYTPLKRLTHWCTIVGAIVGAIPPVMGYAAAANTLDSVALVLFAILFVWQLPHFMAIASLFRDDYRAAGMRMLPALDAAEKRTARQIAFHSLALLVITLWPTYLGITGTAYLMGSLFLGFIFGAFAFDAAVNHTQQAARRLFVASIAYLPTLLGVMMWDKIQA